MDDKRKRQHLDDVENILSEVREELEHSQEQGEIYELRALQLLLRVVKAMHSQHDVYTLIALILDSAISFGEADRGFLMLLDDQGEPRFKMGRSRDGSFLKEGDFVISQSAVKETLGAQKPIILADAQRDEQFAKRESIIDLKIRTVMAAPLRYQDQLLGLIYVDSKRPLARYSKHHLNVLTSLADQAAVAINNARKFETHNG